MGSEFSWLLFADGEQSATGRISDGAIREFLEESAKVELFPPLFLCLLPLFPSRPPQKPLLPLVTGAVFPPAIGLGKRISGRRFGIRFFIETRAGAG